MSKCKVFTDKLLKELSPFFHSEYEDSHSLCLYTGNFKNEIFHSRKAEGFVGNGYDWESLATVFIDEKMPDVVDELEFDSEAGMFVVMSFNAEILKKFAVEFREMCKDDECMLDLFSRAKPDPLLDPDYRAKVEESLMKELV